MALPKIGLEAVFIIARFERDAKTYQRTVDSLTKGTEEAAKKVQSSGQQMAKSFDAFIRASKVMNSDMAVSVEQMQRLSQIWFDMGKPKINVAQFDDAVAKGKSLEDAMKLATSGINTAALATLRMNMALVTASAAVGLVIKALKDAIKDYTKFAEEVRRLQFELGATAEEASAWIRVAEIAGTSSRSLETAIANLQRRIVDYRLAQFESTEESNNFSRAMDTLGVSMSNADGTLRDSTELIVELQQKFQALGPGTLSAGLAYDIFGRGAKEMLPILFDTSQTIGDVTDRARELGALMSGDALKAYNDYRESTRELKLAKEGLGNYFARVFMPLLDELAERFTKLITLYRSVNALILAGYVTATQAVLGLVKLNEVTDAYRMNLTFLLGGTSELTAKEEELAQIRNKAVQDTLLLKQAEGALQKIRDEESEKLDELKEQYDERYARIQQQDYDRLEDMQRAHERQLEDAELALSRRREDIAIQRGRKLEDLTRGHERKLADIRKSVAEKVQEFIDDANKKREDLELKHQQRLQDIQLKYQDTIEEAARSNDAVAVVRAMRQRQRDLRDADLARQREAQGLEHNLAEKREQITKDADTRRQDEIDRYNEALVDQQEAERRQEEDLQLSLRRQEDDRRKSWDRQEEDRIASYNRQMAELRRWFKDEKLATDAHYAEMISAAEQAVINAGNAVAVATAMAIETISTAALNAEQQWLNRHSYLGGYSTPAPPSTIGLTPEEQWRQRHSWFRGTGGLDVVSRPTPFVMGDRGPEAVLSVPLRGQVNVNHQFSPLNVGVNGLPGGMDMASIQTMMWKAFTHIAQQVTDRK